MVQWHWSKIVFDEHRMIGVLRIKRLSVWTGLRQGVHDVSDCPWDNFLSPICWWSLICCVLANKSWAAYLNAVRASSWCPFWSKLMPRLLCWIAEFMIFFLLGNLCAFSSVECEALRMLVCKGTWRKTRLSMDEAMFDGKLNYERSRSVYSARFTQWVVDACKLEATYSALVFAQDLDVTTASEGWLWRQNHPRMTQVRYMTIIMVIAETEMCSEELMSDRNNCQRILRQDRKCS